MGTDGRYMMENNFRYMRALVRRVPSEGGTFLPPMLG